MKRTLHLNLKRKWFDMIKSGEKKEEYRDITPYWCSRFLLFKGEKKSLKWWSAPISSYDNLSMYVEYMIKFGFITFIHHDTITFSNGMTPPVPRFEIDKREIVIGEGNPDWGAIPGEKYFVLKLGDLITD